MTAPRLLRGWTAGVLCATAILAILAVSDAEAQAVSRILLHERPNDPVVAVSVRFPHGSATDPEGAGGAAFLLGLAVEGEGNRRIAEHSARLTVDVGRGEFVVTLVAPSQEWREAWRPVASLLGEGGLPEDAVIRARDHQRERLLFEEGAPGRRFDREMARFLLGSTAPGARPVAGTRESVASLDRGRLESARRDIVRWNDAVAGVVGAVTVAETEAWLQGPVVQVRAPQAPPASGGPGIVVPQGPDTSTGAPPDTTETVAALPPPPVTTTGERGPPLRIPSTGRAPLAWSQGDRRVIDQDVTSSWIMVAWPLAEEAPLLLADFLAHLVREALNPTPPEPGVFSADVRLERVNGSPVLVAVASVDPRTAYQWEARILAAVEEVGAAPPAGSFFELTRRRYRASRLLEQAVPEERVRWMVRSFATSGDVPRIPTEVWGLTRDGVAELATAAGEPRILVFGPRSVMDR